MLSIRSPTFGKTDFKDQLQDNQKQLGENTDELKRLNDYFTSLFPTAAPATPPGGIVSTAHAAETPEATREALKQTQAGAEASREALKLDNQKSTDENTERLKQLNDTLSLLTQQLQPQPQSQPQLQPQDEGADAGDRRAELKLPDPGYVPPLRRPRGFAAAVSSADGAARQAVAENAIMENGAPVAPRDGPQGSMLRRDDRSELDRRILDFMKPLQVEGTGTLTANISAPAGTRVGLAGGGLFKKTQLNRQTQNVLASTGPPNPAYSPTLEDFPL